MPLTILPQNPTNLLPDLNGLPDNVAASMRRVFQDLQTLLQTQTNAINSNVSGSGTTALRPSSNLVFGQRYFDTTLGFPIYWNATLAYWVNSAGAGPQ